MAERREPVTLHFDGTSFSGRMRHAAVVARDLFARDNLRNATWEPIDWSEFD